MINFNIMIDTSNDKGGLEALLASANARDEKQPATRTEEVACSIDNPDCESCSG